MIHKSYLIEENIDQLKNNIVLFYGENLGLKNDFRDKIKLKFKNTKILRYKQEEVLKSSDIIINEIRNISLFDDQKILLIDQVNDKLLNLIEELTTIDNETKIFLFADVLEKRSKLRSFFEKSKTTGIVPCYQDNEITIKRIIMKKLTGYQGLSSDVTDLIIQNTGLDRNKVNNEIDKITSCFQDKKIDLKKIDLLLNIKTSDDFNLLKDEALNGNKINTNRLLADTVFEVENNIYYLNTINQRINKLNEIENMKQEHSNIESIISCLKPPVFWKDKPILIEQSKRWNKEKIQAALKKTYNTEIKMKSNSSIKNDLLIKNLIVELCATASSA